MTNLKDQIAENIRKKRGRSEKTTGSQYRAADAARSRLDDIRPRLDELSHKTDNYSLAVDYAKGPYAELIAVVELDDGVGKWVAGWQVGPTVGGSGAAWEVTYNPRGVDTQREWFTDADGLFEYLTASIAERIVEMEAE